MEYALKLDPERSESCWHRARGESNIRSLNSLVDFLDGHDYEWSISQGGFWTEALEIASATQANVAR